MNRHLYWLASRTYRGFVRLAEPHPFRAGAPQRVVHCAHHRMGSVWFGRILATTAWLQSIEFTEERERLERRPVFLLDRNSRLDYRTAPPFRGTHVIRDPRDVAVSGYHYHLWTDEVWANRPLRENQRLQRAIGEPADASLSYREYLNSRPPDAGLTTEIRRVCSMMLPNLVAWDYGNPSFVELRYEDLIADPGTTFRRVFDHYGFTRRTTRRALRIVDHFSFEKTSGRSLGHVDERSHLRSGRSGQWREAFTSDHRQLFKDIGGQALITLEYETNLDW